MPELSAEEVERRASGIAADHPTAVPVDAYEITEQLRRTVPGLAWEVEPAPGAPAAPVRRLDPIAYRRRLLWRDSATILIGAVVALLAYQAFLSQGAASPSSSSSDAPSGISIGSIGPPLSLAPGSTFGPIIDASLGIDATPTPIPVITLGPSLTASPSPSPSPRPTATPRVSGSPKPTPRPTPKPPSAPPPTAPPTPPPTPPTAAFTWAQSVTPLRIDFTNTSTNDTSWDWDFGDSTSSTAQSPSHLYLGAGDYLVGLTVTGPGGTDTVTHTVTVAP